MLRDESLKSRQTDKLRSYEDLTAEKAAAVGFEDPEQAARLLQDLAGHDIPDARFEELLPALSSSLSRSADPDRSLANIASWLANVGSRSLYYGLLAQHPAALDALVTIFSASQFLSDILIRNPEYFEVLANPAIRDRPRALADFLADASRRITIARTTNAKRDALRRFKPPEVLRIGARDILGYADVPTTVAEISDFAEACVRSAVLIAEAEKEFAVIAMGKLGGHELNYASDIDLIFVHADTLPQEQALKLAESVQDTLARRTDAGLVFRVDLRLRPEGRFGPISRSLSSCRAYYESWAENWERQALLKARYIAGDKAVGQAFIQMIEPFVYRPRVEERFIEEIRENKRRIEKKTARAGESETNVKEGVGAIRDVEFAVQLLQLVAGGAHPALRTSNTLEALDRLVEFKLLSPEENATLRESYLFLRHVEHRLQIMDERPVRNIPTNTIELRKFGRNLGYAGGDEFLADYRRHTSRVNTLFRQLFYGEGPTPPILGTPPDTGGRRDQSDAPTNPPPPVSGGVPRAEQSARVGSWTREVSDWVRTAGEPTSREALIAFLGEKGFTNPEAAYELLRFSQTGSEYGEIPPEARERFAELAPRLIEAASQTSSPDTALQGIDKLALAVPSRAALYLSLDEDEDLVERLCQLAAESPPLWQVLLNHLEFLDMLTEDTLLAAPSPAPVLPRKAPEKPLAVFLRRERLRIGALDIWGMLSTQEIMAELTRMAQSAITATLTLDSKAASGIAVIGMGKLGGAELGYSSDLDVLWVANEDVDTTASAMFAERVMALLRSDLRPYGESFEIDARLRPEGRFGSLVRKVADYASYYRDSADTWEKQALIKARFVAGDARVGEEFLALARAVVYDHPPTEAQAGDMRHMKSRIENERAKGATDLKLGPGGLSDIEWVAQLLQWRHGKRWKKAQVPGTLAALAALRDAGVLRQDDWETLTHAYNTLTHLRNRQWLKDGRGTDTLMNPPENVIEIRRQVRSIFERLFLGE
jgi:glutamate-ammonia-ligase adenylyltransferase